MIISKTPYRVSFFGGGTDYEKWYSKNGGSFISMAINKYCYIYCRNLPPFFSYNSRIVWSKIENVQNISEISHPVIRASLKMEEINNIEIHHLGDLPARSGLGSSSSFSVGILNALRAFKNKKTSQNELAKDAIKLERVILKEAGGIQDQIATSFGGLNYVKIEPSGNFKISTIEISAETRLEFENSLLLVFTGIFRNSSEIAKKQIKKISSSSVHLENIAKITQDAYKTFSSNTFIRDFGFLLNETWENKKRINNVISNKEIDDIYNEAINAGAYGGKLLGAGAGGFMVFVVPKKAMKIVKQRLYKLIQVPIQVDNCGTIISNDFKRK